jgi:hypothetical protein
MVRGTWGAWWLVGALGYYMQVPASAHKNGMQILPQISQIFTTQLDVFHQGLGSPSPFYFARLFFALHYRSGPRTL